MHQKYTVDFNCEFKLAAYPFEVQKCFMTFQLTKTTNEMVVMIYESIKYFGPTDLIEYKVVNITAGKPYLCGNFSKRLCGKLRISLLYLLY